ncbi:MAG TPA: glycosyltransferase family 4 protein [Candidatus Nanoarchaeia archaeon]|nr:glycosyltransferase family 4 protein [Candidatus Nanoarchaeia archaeon]
MKVAIISAYFGEEIGGADISAKLFVDALRKEHQVEIISLTPKRPSQLYQIRIPLPRTLLAFLLHTSWCDRFLLPRLIHMLKQIAPDIVHVQDLSLLPASVEAAAALHIPLIATVRDYRFISLLPVFRQQRNIIQQPMPEEEISLLKNIAHMHHATWAVPFLLPIIRKRPAALRHALSACHHLIAISAFIKRNLVAYGIPAHQITVVHNPAPDWRVPQKPRRKGEYVIFAPGRIEEYKGFQVLLAAVAQLKNTALPNKISVIIAGTGPYLPALQQLAASLKLGNVIFIGKIPYEQMPEQYARCDLVVFPSLWPEPLGRVPIEAIAAGKPIIASRIGGIPEIVTKRTGVLVPPGNARALASAITQFISGKKRIRQVLSLMQTGASYTKQISTIYRSLIVP